MRQKRAVAKTLGLCVVCLKAKVKGSVRCEKCAKYDANHKKVIRGTNKKNCKKCGAENTDGLLCVRCMVIRWGRARV